MRLKKRRIFLFAMTAITAVLALFLVGCNDEHTPEDASEILGGVCMNGVEWQYDSGEFTLTKLDVLSKHRSVMYELAVYDRNGDPVVKVNSTDGKFRSVKIPCDVTGMDEYRLELSFLNSKAVPICDTEVFDVVTVEPDCISSGYQSVYCRSTDTKRVFNTILATGHAYAAESTEIKSDSIVECGYKKFKCIRCGDLKEEPCYQDTGIARLCMYGDLSGIGKQTEVPITVSFHGENESFACYASLKHQGHMSLIHEKKNFTLKLFTDEDRTVKNRIQIRDWKKEHKYVLKANYTDPSACRNLVCAELWAEMVACREGHDPKLNDTSNYGVTDGFPIALYLNDEFFGLYTMTLHRDDDLFHMNNNVTDAIAVTNTSHTDASRFKEKAVFFDTSDWEVEYNGLEDDAWVEDKVNALIDFVKDSSDEVFREKLSEHMEVASAIDYLIFVYALGIPDNASKNITLATYSDGPWILSPSDMECGFGLMPFGTGFYPSDWCLPANNGEKWNSGTDNLLWDRLLDQFEEEFAARYRVLRESVLTPERICGKVKAFVSSVPKEFYEADSERYPEMPFADISAEEQIEKYVVERLTFLDEIFM